jgi:hypothetical protein
MTRSCSSKTQPPARRLYDHTDTPADSDTPGTPLERGRLYARLLHGRADPDQEMDGWGFDGPVFGPLSSVALTYLQDLRLFWSSCHEETGIGAHNGLLVWGGSYFGDLYLFVAVDGDRA